MTTEHQTAETRADPLEELRAALWAERVAAGGLGATGSSAYRLGWDAGFGDASAAQTDDLGQDILDSFLTSVAYLMEEHGTSVIDIVDLTATARAERVAFADRLRAALTPGAPDHE